MPLFDKLAISSPDITALERVPEPFTADGGHSVPRLAFDGVPAGTVELAVICHDPDAPLPHGFTHWTVYGIAPDAVELDLDAARVGPNTLGDLEWTGPEPPHGHGQHHYYFWVYALNRAVDGEPDRQAFLADYTDAILEQARFVATYSR